MTVKVQPGSVFPAGDGSNERSSWRFSYFINGTRVESSFTYSHAGKAKQAMRELVDRLNKTYGG